METRKLFGVWGKVVATKYLGEFLAEDEEDAIEQALIENGSVLVCCECSYEVSDPEIVECEAEEKKQVG